MFESAEIEHSLDKKVFKRKAPKLREALLDAQFDLAEKKPFEVVILIAGLAAAGKGETANMLTEWMDPRRIDAVAAEGNGDGELERPPMWRFWRELPPKGRIGVFLHTWYQEPVAACVGGTMKRAEFDKRLEEIRSFERMLADEGALVLKFWLHLTRKQQRKRLESLEGDKATRWRVTKADWKENNNYDAIIDVWRHALRMSNTAHAAWTIVSAADNEFRSLTVAETLAKALRARLDAPKPKVVVAAPAPLAPVDGKRLLDTLDLSQRMADDEYQERLETLQGRLSRLTRKDKFHRLGAVVVFEGMDAAGKGGAIRRVTGGLDARYFRVVPVAAPTDDEKAHPYLWRFWRHLPRRGHFTIFDRSWYGRVLVERVEKFADEADWLRAYAEINDFEDQMVRHGTVVSKFWLAISADEQMRRFKEREATGFKRYKITPDDWRNRKKWDDYVQAANDMFERTSTGLAPWTVVAAENKKFARIKVLETLTERIAAALD